MERRFDLREGDLILMVSDGVPTEEPWVEEQLAAWEGEASCRAVPAYRGSRPPALPRVKTGRYYGGGPATGKRLNYAF